MRVVSDSAAATRAIAKQLGEAARGPLAILLSGDYGTGKTTFVQGLAKGLGYEGAVRSPSYNIMKCYQGGRLTLVHVDLYRTASQIEIDELGIAEIMPADGVLAVEWPAAELQLQLGMPCLAITFSYIRGEDGGPVPQLRELEFEWPEGSCEPIAEVLDALAAG